MAFLNWWQPRCKSASGIRLVDVLHLRRYKNYFHLKFQQGALIHYYGFLKTSCRHIEIIFPVFILSFSSSLACDPVATYQTLYEFDDQRQSYAVMWQEFEYTEEP